VSGARRAGLSSCGWLASASVNFSTASSGVDGKLATRWNTGSSQANGQWYQLDMLAPQTFNQITLDADGYTGDYPRGYQVFVSNDGATWGTPVVAGIGSAPFVSIGFATQRARYLRVVQAGAASQWWSIAEINVVASAACGVVRRPRARKFPRVAVSKPIDVNPRRGGWGGGT
jgi:beta-glucosidase